MKLCRDSIPAEADPFYITVDGSENVVNTHIPLKEESETRIKIIKEAINPILNAQSESFRKFNNLN